MSVSWEDPEGGGQGVRANPGKSQKYRFFFSKTGSGPLKNHKATKAASMKGHHWHDRETPFKWRFAGGLMMAS